MPETASNRPLDCESTGLDPKEHVSFDSRGRLFHFSRPDSAEIALFYSPLDGPRNKEYGFPGTSGAKILWLDGITDSPIEGTNLLEPTVEASRLKTTAVGPGPCLEIRLVLDSGPVRPVGGRDSCVIWCG